MFWIRSSLVETEAFRLRKHRSATQDILYSLARNWPLILAGMLMVTTTTVMFYTITAYTPTFGKTVMLLNDRESFIVTFCVGLSNLFCLPVMGTLSDRVGRRPLLIIFTILMIATAWPTLRWLVYSPSLAHLLAVELWLSFLYASYNSAMVVWLTEIMPPGGACFRVLSGLQPSNRPVCRLHASHCQLPDTCNRGQINAMSVDKHCGSLWTYRDAVTETHGKAVSYEPAR